MNKQTNASQKTQIKNITLPKKSIKSLGEIKFQESPMERAMKLSSDETLAKAIRDLMKRDDLN